MNETKYEIANELGLSVSTVYAGMRIGKRYDWVLCVLRRKELSDREKRKYINSLSISDQNKSKIWNKYKGGK